MCASSNDVVHGAISKKESYYNCDLRRAYFKIYIPYTLPEIESLISNCISMQRMSYSFFLYRTSLGSESWVCITVDAQLWALVVTTIGVAVDCTGVDRVANNFSLGFNGQVSSSCGLEK